MSSFSCEQAVTREDVIKAAKKCKFQLKDEHEIDSSSDDIRLRNIPPSTTTTPFLEVSSSMIPTCGWLERLWNRCK